MGSSAVIRSLAKRSYATAAQPKAKAAGVDVQVTSLPTKTVVASADSPAAGLSRIAIGVRAGSRYENGKNVGASHVLRNSAGLSTKSATQFSIMRNIQQAGGSLSVTGDRELVIYSLEATNDKIDDCLKLFQSAVTEQEFRPWELSDNEERLKTELATIPAQAKLLDLLHKAAYRDTLGNSIFVKKFNIKKLGSETMQHFFNCNFLSGRTGVAGVGVPHDSLCCFAENLGLGDGNGESTAAKYKGGEMRKDVNSPLSHMILASEASSLLKKDVFAFGVLQYALGSGCGVKRGTGADPLNKSVANIHGPAIAQAVNLAHSDSGLFGIYMCAEADNAKAVAESVMKVLKAGVTDADINRGKAQLKAAILYSGENTGSLANDLVSQATLVGGARSPQQLAAEIDSVTAAQVQQALEKVRSGKKSMAALGALHNTPYIDEL